MSERKKKDLSSTCDSYTTETQLNQELLFVVDKDFKLQSSWSLAPWHQTFSSLSKQEYVQEWKYIEFLLSLWTTLQDTTNCTETEQNPQVSYLTIRNLESLISAIYDDLERDNSHKKLSNELQNKVKERMCYRDPKVNALVLYPFVSLDFVQKVFTEEFNLEPKEFQKQKPTKTFFQPYYDNLTKEIEKLCEQDVQKYKELFISLDEIKKFSDRVDGSSNHNAILNLLSLLYSKYNLVWVSETAEKLLLQLCHETSTSAFPYLYSYLTFAKELRFDIVHSKQTDLERKIISTLEKMSLSSSNSSNQQEKKV
jgi:hypothetical protein